MTDDAVDITPDDSVVPVFLDASPQVPIDSGAPLEEQVETELARDRAIAKLRTALGLTDAEALALGM